MFRAVGWFVPLLVWCVALVRGATAAEWRGDLPALRDRGLVSEGFGGSVSSVVTQFFSLLPLGSHPQRAAAGSAFALALASFFLYRLAFRLLVGVLLDHSGQRRSGDEPLAVVLAGVGTLTSALSPSWQAEGTLGGGAAVALALVLGALDGLGERTGEASSLTPSATRAWLRVALCLGLTLAESPPAALALILVSLAMVATSERPPPSRFAFPLVAVALGVAVLVGLPRMWRPFSPGSWADFGRLLSSTGLRAAPRSSAREAVFSWLQQLGLVQLLLAALGLCFGAARARNRSVVMMLVALPFFELLAPLSPWLDASRTSYGQLCVAAFGLAGALGVAVVVRFLRGLELPMARIASVLALVSHMTLAAVVCEEASFATDRTDRLAAEEWTDFALARLPRDAALVVRSPELAWRLWAAQRVEGQRPDIVLVAAPLLARYPGFARTLPPDPALAPLLRDLALTGRASEFSLSALADARPLRVELDPSWNAQFISHILLDGPWLRFDPQPLGASDRPVDGANALATEGRIAAHLRGGARLDALSAQVLGRTLKEQASMLSQLGLSAGVPPLLDELDRLLPLDPFALSARLRVEHALQHGRTGPVELRDLLRF